MIVFGLGHNSFGSQGAFDYAISFNKKKDQIDLINFYKLPLLKEYYFSHVLKWSKKKEKWVYEK